MKKFHRPAPCRSGARRQAPCHFRKRTTFPPRPQRGSRRGSAELGTTLPVPNSSAFLQKALTTQ